MNVATCFSLENTDLLKTTADQGNISSRESITSKGTMASLMDTLGQEDTLLCNIILHLPLTTIIHLPILNYPMSTRGHHLGTTHHPHLHQGTIPDPRLMTMALKVPSLISHQAKVTKRRPQL